MVWEDGRREAPSYPIANSFRNRSASCWHETRSRAALGITGEQCGSGPELVDGLVDLEKLNDVVPLPLAGVGGAAGIGGMSGVGGAGGTGGAGAQPSECPVSETANPSGDNWVNGDLITFNDSGGWCWYQDERAIVDTDTNQLIIGSV